MTAQWQVGKTYEFIPEMVERFSATNDSNFQIAEILKGRQFIVEEVESGRVINIQGFKRFVILDWWFYPEEIKYFREVGTSNSVDIAVIGWLDKLYYVLSNDTNTDTAVNAGYASLILSTDTVDICGSDDLYRFISTRYDQLHEVNRKELQSKREALLAELAEIDKQLGK